MDELPVGVRAAMAMANGNRPTMTAEVVAVEEVQEKSVFVVKVSTAHDSYNSYNVRRRYRQFDALHAVLKLGYRNLPELPGKGGMSGGRGDQKFIDKRRDGLSAYLRALIADPVLAGCDDVRSFLEFGSAEQLMGKLHEKDLMVNVLVGEKDKAHEQLRKRLAEVRTSLPYSSPGHLGKTPRQDTPPYSPPPYSPPPYSPPPYSPVTAGGGERE